MHRTICDAISEIVHNSIEADAGSLELDIIHSDDLLTVRVADNGCGMDEETLKRAVDPFYTQPGKHSNRRVGLGLPFLIQAVELANGTFSIESKPGVGTTIIFSYQLSQIDTPPLGGLVETIVSLMAFSEKTEIIIKRVNKGHEYSVSRSELLEALGDLASVDSLTLANRYIQSLEDDSNT